MATWSGQCCCGAVRYEIRGEVLQLVNCHCNLCRSMNGSAFSSYALVVAEDLAVVAGEELVSKYRIVNTATKHFCIRCGTPIFNTNPGRHPGTSMVYLGTLAGGRKLRPFVNVYCSDKLDWVTPNSDAINLPQGPEDLAAH